MLGEPLWDPDQRKAVVEFSEGDACPEYTWLKLTASVIFTCQPGPDMVSINKVASDRPLNSANNS